MVVSQATDNPTDQLQNNFWADLLNSSGTCGNGEIAIAVKVAKVDKHWWR